jgi:hypothetical protein
MAKREDCPKLEELVVYIFYPERLSEERQQFFLAHTSQIVCRYCYFDKVRFSAELTSKEVNDFIRRWENGAPQV